MDDQPITPTELSSTWNRLSVRARRALWRAGLMETAWKRKLNQAPQAVVQFIQSFSQVSGFEYPVKGFFGNRLQKRAAIMGMQLTRAIADRNPDQLAGMIFKQDVGYSPGAGVFLTLQLDVNGRTCVILPWTQLDEQAVRKQFACHQELFGSMDAFRWVLSSQALAMQKEEVVNQLRAILETNSSQEYGEASERFQRLVIVLP